MKLECTRCHKEFEFGIKPNETTPEGKRIWDSVRKAADSCPTWLRAKIKKQVHASIEELKKEPVCANCDYKDRWG